MLIVALPSAREDKPFMSSKLITLSGAGYGDALLSSTPELCAETRARRSFSRRIISGIKTRIIHSITLRWWSTISSAVTCFNTRARCSLPVRSMYTGHPIAVWALYQPLLYPTYVFSRRSSGMSRHTRIFASVSVLPRHSMVPRSIFSALAALPPCALRNRRYVAS